MKTTIKTTVLLSVLILMGASTLFAQKDKKEKKETKVSRTFARDTFINMKMDMKEKEVSKEIEVPANAIVRLTSSNHNLEIKTWKENKVKVVTKALVDEKSTASNDELLDREGISLHSSNNRVEINLQGGHGNNRFYFNNFGDGPHVFHFDYNNDKDNKIELRDGNEIEILKDDKDNDGDKDKEIEIMTEPKLKQTEKEVQRLKENARTYSYSFNGPAIAYAFNNDHGGDGEVTVYVPEGAKLDIDNKYGNISLTDDYKDANIKISNCTMDARNFGALTLQAKYSNVNMGDVNDAEIEFENGKFTAGNIKDLDMDSKYSTIEYETGGRLTMRSRNDNYDIEELEKLEGRKLYGDLRINKLSKSFDLEGVNADVRIRKLAPGVEKISLKDKFADVRLPVRDLQNYSVSYEGNYSTVFAPFEKKMIKQEPKKEEYIIKDDKDEKKKKEEFIVKDDKEEKKKRDDRMIGNEKIKKDDRVALEYKVLMDREYPRNYTWKIESDNAQKFTAAVGNTSGPHTQFILECNQCTVDFK